MDGWGGRLNSLGGYTSNYLMKNSCAGHQKERERERTLVAVGANGKAGSKERFAPGWFNKT